MKEFLTKQVFGVPVYAIAVGLVVLVGGYWFFKRMNTGQASATPQVNSGPIAGNQYPYPQPGSSTAPQPPISPFSYGQQGYVGGRISPSGPSILGAHDPTPWNPTIAPSINPAWNPSIVPVSNFVSPSPAPTPSQAAATTFNTRPLVQPSIPSQYVAPFSWT